MGPTDRRPRLAAFALPVHDGRVLLARHSYGPPQWAMVGGVVAEGEAVEAAARREVLEETGLWVQTGPLLAVADREDLSLYVFEARPGVPDVAVHPQAGEIDELAWFTEEDLYQRDDVFELARVLALRLLSGRATASLGRVELDWPSGERVRGLSGSARD